MDFVGIWHYACCTRSSFIKKRARETKRTSERASDAECDGREYIEIIILAGYVFFNNLDCVHDNDESTQVMMTKKLMIILYL